MLDPEFHEHDASSNEEVTSGFINIVEKIVILKAVRDNLPAYFWKLKARCVALGDDPPKLATYEAFPTYPTVKDSVVSTFCQAPQAVDSQLIQYRGKKGVFSRDWVMASARTMPAYLWWDANGASCVELQYVIAESFVLFY